MLPQRLVQFMKPALRPPHIPEPRDPPTVLLAMHCARSRTELKCHCAVRCERPLITSCPIARRETDTLRERKLWWKKFKIKRFASGFGKIWDSRSIEWKEKLSTDPLTAVLLSLTIFMGFMEFRAGTVGFRLPSRPSFLIRDLKNQQDDRKWVTVYCASVTSKFRRRGVVDDARQSRIRSSCNPQASAGINPLF